MNEEQRTKEPQKLSLRLRVEKAMKRKMSFSSLAMLVVGFIFLITMATVVLMYWGYSWGHHRLESLLPPGVTVDPKPSLSLRDFAVKRVILNSAASILLGLNIAYFATREPPHSKISRILLAVVIIFGMIGMMVWMRADGPWRAWVVFAALSLFVFGINVARFNRKAAEGS